MFSGELKVIHNNRKGDRLPRCTADNTHKGLSDLLTYLD